MDLREFIAKFFEVILSPIIALLFALAVLYFFWGIFVFIRDATSEDGRSTGKKHMIWGIVGMTIMLSAFGIIRLITATFGIPEGDLPEFPGQIEALDRQE